MTGLPSGWVTARLDELLASEPAAITDGPFGSNLKTEHYTETGPRVIRLQNVGDGIFRDERAHISSERFEALKKHEARAGDVVIAALGEVLPRACVIPPYVGPAIVKADCIRARLHPEINALFVKAMLNSPEVRRTATADISGVGRPRLNLAKIRSIRVPVPPRAEQERIVAAIDEQFSRLDEAERLLRSARRRAQRLRTAAMAAATSGDWPVKTLADVTTKQEYGSSTKASATHANGVPIVRMGNIQDGRIDLSRDVKYLPPDHPDAARYGLQDGDLLFNRTNSPDLVGKSAVYRGSPDSACFASYLIRVQVDNRCVPEWASLYVNSPSGRRWAASVRSQQVGQANINGSKLAAMPLPLPPLAEQHCLLGQVERQISLVESAIRVVDRALVRTGRLRQAILERAFSGQLVPQDPSDAPASELLARLRAETSANLNGSRSRKRS